MDKVEAMVLDQIEQSGETIFWAVLKEKADLSRAPTIQNSDERGEFVYDELTKVADESQSGLNSLLSKEGVSHESFWIANAVRITADRSVLAQVAALPEVDKVLADRTHDLPEPQPVDALPTVDAVEWGIDRIRADDVWSTFGVRGEGLVVANVDSGVQFDHPALVGRYRGNLGGGSFDHNYNWFDPSHICPTPAPCDNNDHGTHMGTMVGDDGAGNQIGVAPGARWIAAKGCETNNCSLSRCSPPASGSWRRPTSTTKTRGRTWPRTSSTTPGAARATTRSTRRPCRPGWQRGSSRSSPTATTGPAVTRPARPATT